MSDVDPDIRELDAAIGPLFAAARKFDGATLKPTDNSRLRAQLDKVRSVMLAGGWFTLEQLSTETLAPQASVSARLRDLRKLKFGAYNVERRAVPGHRGLYQYHIGNSRDAA